MSKDWFRFYEGVFCKDGNLLEKGGNKEVCITGSGIIRIGGCLRSLETTKTKSRTVVFH